MMIQTAGDDDNEPDADTLSQLWWKAPPQVDNDIINLLENYHFWSDF